MPHYVVFICIYYYKSHRTHIINIQPSLELFFKNTTVWLMARLSFWPCNSPPQRFNHMYPNVSMWVSNIGYPDWLAKKKRTHICFFSGFSIYVNISNCSPFLCLVDLWNLIYDQTNQTFGVWKSGTPEFDAKIHPLTNPHAKYQVVYSSQYIPIKHHNFWWVKSC
jgi:hypothetical protein